MVADDPLTGTAADLESGRCVRASALAESGDHGVIGLNGLRFGGRLLETERASAHDCGAELVAGERIVHHRTLALLADRSRWSLIQPKMAAGGSQRGDQDGCDWPSAKIPLCSGPSAESCEVSVAAH